MEIKIKKTRNSLFTPSILLIKKFLIFLIIISLNITQIKTIRNSTTCYKMFLNKTITENCFNSTACCFMDYSLEDKNFTKCVKKNFYNEDVCGDIATIMDKEGVIMKHCDCKGYFINFSVLLMIFVVKILLF